MKKILVCGAALALAQCATAGVVVTFLEVGPDVQATLSGTLDTAALGSFGGTSGGFNGFYPPGGYLSMNATNSEWYNVNMPWTPFGPGPDFSFWDSSSGDPWHMFSNPALGIPVGYSSNSPLSGSSTKLNASFASLGLDLGSYVTTLTGPNGVQDTVTVNILIPAPGAAALLGVAGLGIARRRR